MDLRALDLLGRALNLLLGAVVGIPYLAKHRPTPASRPKNA